MKPLRNIAKSNFFKNIALLTSGSILAQAITVICSPLLTRLYTADEIGMYSYLIAMVNTFTAAINGRYDMAIVSEEQERNVFPLIKLSIIIGGLVSVIATIIFGIYFCVVKKEYAQYKYMIILFFMLLVANGLINIFNSYNNRVKEYKLMTSVYVVRTACQNIGGVILGVFKTNVLGLVLPYTVGQYMGLYRQGKSLFTKFREIWSCDRHSVKRMARKHIQFPLFSLPATFANSFSYSSITLFMESLFDMATIGYYSISTRILGLPLSLISGNVSKVFFQEASIEYAESRQYKSAFKKTVSFLVLLAIPIGSAMYIVAPWACQIFFGDSWRIAGEYIRILTPYFAVRFVGTALSPGFLVCNQQKQELFIQVILVMTSFVSYWITLYVGVTVEHFLWSICITKSLVYIILVLLVGYNSQVKERRKND